MMRKNYLWLSAIALTLYGAIVFTACTSNEADPLEPAAKADINEVNFPDANFRKFLLEQNYGKDGILTAEEIREIHVMDVSEKEICSLKGIELFTALDTLNCSSNDITALDLSRNTALRNLDCSFCGMASLDVSGNKELRRLRCSFNQLTALDVTRNELLADLDCGFNDLTELDVSKNTVLKELGCHSNNLISIDVSRNLELYDLQCSNNEMPTIDVSMLTALTKLYCGGNQLTALDVSKNTALTRLYCEKNQLTVLDIPKNTALTALFLFRNNISGKSMDDLISSLPQNTSSESFMFGAIDNREGDEKNIVTPSQAAAAKQKGWSPVYWDDDEEEWIEIE